jgi:hypothetical protein
VKKLEDLGFAKGTISETLVSTYSNQGYPNIAPMGAINIDQKKIMIRIYKSSNTFKNLKAKRCAIVNLSSNPTFFYKSAIKEANYQGKFASDFYEKGTFVDAPKLKNANASIEVIVREIKDLDSERAEIIFDVKSINAKRILPKVYCRAFGVLIESIILATRIKIYLRGNELQQKQAFDMIKKVQYYIKIVKRTAPNSEYTSIMDDLMNTIDIWKNKK